MPHKTLGPELGNAARLRSGAGGSVLCAPVLFWTVQTVHREGFSALKGRRACLFHVPQVCKTGLPEGESSERTAPAGEGTCSWHSEGQRGLLPGSENYLRASGTETGTSEPPFWDGSVTRCTPKGSIWLRDAYLSVTQRYEIIHPWSVPG